jgi:hypothetical protein
VNDPILWTVGLVIIAVALVMWGRIRAYLHPSPPPEYEAQRQAVRDEVHNERNLATVITAQQRQERDKIDDLTKTVRKTVARLEIDRRRREQAERKR